MRDLHAKAPDQSRIAQSFRRAMRSYGNAASVQAEIAAALAGDLAAAMTAVSEPLRFDQTVEFGCGTGHLTRALTKQFEIGALTLNDLVNDCAQTTALPSTRFLAGPIETCALPQNQSLIASASTIQWIADLPGLFSKLADHLAPGGWLALSGFGPRQFTELAALGAQSAAPSYIDATTFLAMLPSNLQVHAVHHRPVTLHFDGLAPLLRHLRDTGVNGAARTHWTKTKLIEFEKDYLARFGQDGRLPLTYDPIRLIARKAP